MTRILHITGGMQRAGAETLLMNLYRNLDRANFQFDFVYFTAQECDYDQEIIDLGGRIFRIPPHKGNRIVRVFRRFYDFHKLLKRLNEHQVIHSHINLNGAFLLWIAALQGKKVRVSHSHISKGSKAVFPSIYRFFTRTIIKKASNIYMACGEAAGRYLYPSIVESDVIVFPNSIDIKEFQKFSNRKDYLRNELNIPASTPMIVQIGRFTFQKNFEFTIDFAEYLKKHKEEFFFVFLGTGPLEDKLKSLVKEKGLSDYIHFYGISSDIPTVLHGADLFFMPSNLEGFPVVLVEAQACGIPCLISTNISKEVDMELGLVNFLPLDAGPEKWHTELKKVLKNRSYDFNHIYEVMSNRNFDASVSVKKLEKIYTSKLSK